MAKTKAAMSWLLVEAPWVKLSSVAQTEQWLEHPQLATPKWAVRRLAVWRRVARQRVVRLARHQPSALGLPAVLALNVSATQCLDAQLGLLHFAAASPLGAAPLTTKPRVARRSGVAAWVPMGFANKTSRTVRTSAIQRIVPCSGAVGGVHSIAMAIW